MTAPTMAEVLAEHEYAVGSDRLNCACGWRRQRANADETLQAVHRTHLAAALAAAGFGHVGTMKARAEAAEAQVAAVRAARADHPMCDRHDEGDPVSCGWKQVVLDIDAALNTGGDDV